MPNAIDTLRWEGTANEDDYKAALRDVEALLQAAEPFAENFAWWENPHTRTTEEPRIIKPQVAALAAAVRKVKGEA